MGISDGNGVHVSEGSGTVATDEVGNFYLLMETTESINYINNLPYLSNNGRVFLMKYNAIAELLWVQQLAETTNHLSPVSYSNGRVYFGKGVYNAIVTSYDTTGVFRWQKESGNGNPNMFKTFGLFSTESNVFVSGFFEGEWTIDGHTIEAGSLGGNNDFFIGKIHECAPYNAGSIVGPMDACHGDQNVTYAVDPIQLTSTYNWSVDGPSISSQNGNTIELDFSNGLNGTISVQAENTCGFGGISPEVNVTVHSVPDAGSIFGQQDVCNNSVHSYAAVDYSNLSYSWSVSNGIIISGESTNEISVGWGSPGIGVATLTVTDTVSGGNCEQIIDVSITVNDCPVGINGISNPMSIKPNPTNAKFEIQLSGFNHNAFHLFDNLGKVVTSGKLVSEKTTIDVSSMPKGIYLLQVQTAQGMLTRKLVKE